MKSLLRNLENSEYYKRFRISNFLEGDFFSWYVDENSNHLSRAIRAIAQQFLDFEPASALLRPEGKKDLLKEFYTSLVDQEIRHDLGEYYTPDWLAQHMLDRIGYNGNSSQPILDPACGSGTFLVESIERIRRRYAAKPPLETLRIILRNVKGLDLNPLAVISARANYILAIYDLAFGLGYDIEIPVFLADSINVPVQRTDEAGQQVLEYFLDTELEELTLRIPLSLVGAQVLGKVLLKCEDTISLGKDKEFFLRQLQTDKTIAPHLTSSVVARLEGFFDQIASLEERDWDKIWCRIVKNNFSPRGFAPFSFIVGNPPWVRWSRLPQTYRNRVKAFCNYYGLVSGRGYSGGIESDISTVITFSAADNWLKLNGIISFLITWPVFKSASARGFRLGYLPNGDGLRLIHLEDLTGLQPFPDATNATSIYAAKKVDNHEDVRFSSIPCAIWRPQRGLSRVDPALSLESVKNSVDILVGAASPVAEWGTPLFTGDKTHFDESAFLRGSSDYLKLAHRGTISDAARIYWVRVERFSRETNRALIRTLNEDELTQARQVSPVEGAWVEADVLYPLMRGRDLGRYSFDTEGWYQLIPNPHYDDVLNEDDFAERYPLAYSYLMRYDSILSNRSSYKRYQSHLPQYVIYCVGDYSFLPHKVVWMEQQNPGQFRAAVIGSVADALLPNRVLVPDHKLYFVGLDSEQEAHYLCGFLNSRPVRTWLGGFLLDKQIGTSIFQYMKVPVFVASHPLHERIAHISKLAHSEREGSTITDELSLELEMELAECVKSICSEANGT